MPIPVVPDKEPEIDRKLWVEKFLAARRGTPEPQPVSGRLEELTTLKDEYVPLPKPDPEPLAAEEWHDEGYVEETGWKYEPSSPPRRAPGESYLDVNERAMLRLAGEVVADPELPPQLAFENTPTETRLLCPRCGSAELLLRGTSMRPEIEPDDVTVAVRCECGLLFGVLFERTAEGIVIEIAED